MTLPGLALGRGLADEKNLALVFFVRVRVEQQDGFLLFDAGQVEQIGIWPQQQHPVGVGGQNVIGIGYCQRVGQ